MAVVRGNAEIAALGRLVKAQGEGQLRRDLLAGLRKAAKPLVADVRQAAFEELPKHGGLNVRVAESKIGVRTRLTGASAGVRIVNTAPAGKKGGTRDFGTDTGHLRHPVFGTDRWVTQELATPGWFSKTLEQESPKVTPEVLAAMRETLERIAHPGAGMVALGGFLAAVEGSF